MSHRQYQKFYQFFDQRVINFCENCESLTTAAELLKNGRWVVKKELSGFNNIEALALITRNLERIEAELKKIKMIIQCLKEKETNLN